MRPTSLLTLAFFTFAGCSSGGGEPSTDGAAASTSAVELDPARLEAAWVGKYPTNDSFGDYGSAAWVELVKSRNYRKVAEALGTGSGRAHAEAAALYRAAAMVSANSVIETYAMTPQETDPVGAAHLLSIGWSLRGDLAKAREASTRLDGVDDVTSPWHGPWKAWLSGDAQWPPDLAALPVELPEPAPGAWPVLEDVPHYEMPEQTEGDFKVKMGDPGSLVMLAMWHEKAAKMVSDPAVVDTYLARYRFPVEPAPAGASLPDDFLYASDFLVAEDGPFMAALTGEQGAAAVDAHKDRSLMAYLADRARRGGKLDAESAVDVATELRGRLLELNKTANGGNVEVHHRWFADMAYVGALRNLALVAEAEGNREEGGKLRLLAKDASHDHTGCVVALMSLAAWDAGNRYPSRAQEIIHQNSRFYPSLEAARFGLDVLALRRGREVVETPGM